MIIVILVLLLVLGIAFFQVSQGLFSALIMTLLSLVCAAIAFNYYESLAQALMPNMPSSVGGLSLLGLFALPLLALRLVSDQFLKGNVVFGVWADRIGGGVLGLITGMICVGVLMIAAQMLPFGPTILTYAPFDDTLQRNQTLAPLYPDDFTLAAMKSLAGGSLKGEQADQFALRHNEFPLAAFGDRNQLEQEGKNDSGEPVRRRYGSLECRPDCMKVLSAYGEFSYNGVDAAKLPDYPLTAPEKPSKLVVVRVSVDDSAKDPNGWFALPATHFRLVCKNGKFFYPVAYLFFKGGAWEAVTAPMKDTKAEIGKLGVVRTLKDNKETMVVDWVYRLPDDETPVKMIFRGISESPVGDIKKQAAPAAKALTTKK